MSLATILVIVLVICLLGGLGGPRFGAPWAYGYGFGNGGIGIVGVLLIIAVVLLLTGRL